MEECVFFIPHVDKSGVEAGHELLYLSEVNIAHGVCDVSRFFLKRDKASIFKKSYREIAGLNVDNQFTFHQSRDF